VNLLIVDDHALFREGLRALLANISPDVTVFEAGSVHAAVAECGNHIFRMVLLDLALHSTDGLESLTAFRTGVPDVPVIVLSGEQAPRHIRAAIQQGAVGFIPKSHSSELMITALRFVLAGGIYLPPHVIEDDPVLNSVTSESAASVRSAFARLSARQLEVAELLLQGSPNKVIARRLAVSEGTVKAHVSAIFQVIGAKSRVDAVIIAAKSGIKVM
jgi:two-component system nitrate/nitrite response regulator NarL